MSNFYIFAASIIGALIGGLITGYFMILQAKKEFKNRQNLINQEDEKTEKAVLQALKTEIETIWDRYKDNIKPDIEELLKDDYSRYFSDINKYQDDLLYFHNKLLPFRFLISQDYFSIYNGNASFIGKIKNSELRKEIVSCYINIKGFLEIIIAFERNNQDEKKIILEKNLKEISKNENYTNEGRTPVIMIFYKDVLNRIINDLTIIKTEQDKLTDQIYNLINFLENEISQNYIEIKEKNRRNNKDVQEKPTYFEKFLDMNNGEFKFDSIMKIIENSIILGLVLYIGVINGGIFFHSYLTNHHKFLFEDLISGIVLILLSMILLAFNSLKLSSLFFINKNRPYKKPFWQKENWPLIALSVVSSLIFIFFILPIFNYKLQLYDYHFYNTKKQSKVGSPIKAKSGLPPLNVNSKIKVHQ
ncbi:MAG: hypothetical protein M0016_01255 [Deltaproteobacteria bacterium]|jgi:gas vesicle protein|nr:hypothetical protein [Deltaproteobacteria bacterium]MCL5880839.1 hypothetical protein [Deltaproteobacteria bacterium]MDA8303777.1 hypothetical protein [Deltaproteobacteria bacterium]